MRNRSSRLGAASFLAAILWCSSALGQTPPAAPSPGWVFHGNLTGNFVPDETDYLQPTIMADRGALHVEGRYNYEGLESVSSFAGWNHETDGQFALTATPMFGGVVGKTHGLIPALEFTLGWHELELYSESEYVFDLDESSDSFFYDWSELTLAPAEWIAAGAVIQRSRLIHNSRDVQSGPMVRVSRGAIEAAAHFFNPGSNDHYFLASVALSFPFR